MTYTAVYVATLITVPIAIAGLIVFGRKELWRAIVLFSVFAIVAGSINLVLWILQVAHRLPHMSPVSSGIITPVDATRVFTSGLSSYTSATAWVLSLLVSAQQRRIIWAPVLTLIGIGALVSLYVADHPYSFFPRSSAVFGYQILLVLVTCLTPILMLIFALVTRTRRVVLSAQVAAYASPPPISAE